jgi:predicted ATPase
VALSIEQGFPLYLALSTILWGWGLFQQGQREQGIDQMKQGLDLSQAVNNILALPHFPTMLAEAHGEERQTEEGLTVLAVSLTTTDKTGVRFYEAELHRLKGELLLQQSPDNTAEAEFCFQQALEVSRRQEAKSLELRTATSLARLWQSQDKRQEAYDLLAPVYGWFTEGFDTADLIDAKALLDELT